MNVKPGILARIVVNDDPMNRHGIVHVDHACMCRNHPALGGGGWWNCTAMQSLRAEGTRVSVFGATLQMPPVTIPPGTSGVHLHDSCLRPLGGDGEDEMLRIAGKPKGKTVKEELLAELTAVRELLE